jgi:vacuolar-type H+-ATPase subunit I/STV1
LNLFWFYYGFISVWILKKTTLRFEKGHWVVLATPGTPSTGVGYVFYVILLIIGYLAGYYRKSNKHKRAKYIVPSVLFLIICGLVIFLTSFHWFHDCIATRSLIRDYVEYSKIWLFNDGLPLVCWIIDQNILMADCVDLFYVDADDKVICELDMACLSAVVNVLM